MVSAILCLLQSACTDFNSPLLKGPGTTLAVGDTDRRSDAQSRYFLYLCAEIGKEKAACEAADEPALLRIVLIALNDIDDRCETYISSLRQAKIEGDSFIAQLNRTSASAASILGQTFDKSNKHGVQSIAIVQAAFNMSQQSLKDYYSRMLLAIPPTDVQQIVLKRQTAFRQALRDGVAKVVPANGNQAERKETSIMRTTTRADASYIIRNYLSICTPASIEASISEGLEDYFAFKAPRANTDAPTQARM